MSRTANLISELFDRDPWFHCPQQDFTKLAKPGKSVKVSVNCGYSYNGGTVIDGKWYAGFDVPPPIVPPGYELVDMGMGLEYNARPPYLTQKLREITT